MAHTNNAKRKTRTHSVLPKKRAKVSTRAHTHSDYAEVEVPHEPPVEATREEQAAIITEYHALEKQLAQTTDLLERRLITNRQEELGGLEGYQKASIHGGDKVRGGESGKWLCGALQEMREATKAGRKVLAKGKPTIMEKIRLLDVGAIAGTAYDAFPWVEATSIDINSQSAKVTQCDFFDYPIPTAPEALFDVVALSLVLNFVGSLTKRADMLRRAHSFLRPGGYLYLVLPLPCISNSRYMDQDRLTGILTSTGWTSLKQHDSNRLTFMLLQQEGDGSGNDTLWKKEEVRSGAQRNNFCIVIKAPEAEE